MNSSSGYYNDICYTASSNKGTDIILKNRKKEFVESNKTVCQEDCYFSAYDYNTQRIKCLCKVKESSSVFCWYENKYNEIIWEFCRHKK